jgi:hypothetical protein
VLSPRRDAVLRPLRSEPHGERQARDHFCYTSGIGGQTGIQFSWYVRGAGTGQCSANDSPLKLSFQGTCGDDTAETDPACRTLQTCTSDSDCSGTRAGRCALVGNGPVRACQCNITNATCASPYTCDTTQNRCVYNDQCKTQSGNILVDPFAGAYSPLAVLPWVDGIERYGAGGTVENPELRANGNTPSARRPPGTRRTSPTTRSGSAGPT